MTLDDARRIMLMGVWGFDPPPRSAERALKGRLETSTLDCTKDEMRRALVAPKAGINAVELVEAYATVHNSEMAKDEGRRLPNIDALDVNQAVPVMTAAERSELGDALLQQAIDVIADIAFRSGRITGRDGQPLDPLEAIGRMTASSDEWSLDVRVGRKRLLEAQNDLVDGWKVDRALKLLTENIELFELPNEQVKGLQELMRDGASRRDHAAVVMLLDSSSDGQYDFTNVVSEFKRLLSDHGPFASALTANIAATRNPDLRRAVDRLVEDGSSVKVLEGIKVSLGTALGVSRADRSSLGIEPNSR
jgi:hypothetical protein